MSTPELIVLRQTGLGDLVSGLPALRALRRAFPKHRMRMTCPSWLAPLATHLRVADILVTEDHGAGGPVEHESADESMVRKALESVRSPDVLVALRAPERDVARAVVDGPARLVIAYRHPEIDATAPFPTFSFDDHILLRWERLLDRFGVVSRRADLHFRLPVGAARGGRHTVIHVGAGSPARRWPEERWSQVARALEMAGHRVLLTGSEDEAALVARVRGSAGIPRDRDVSGRTDVLALAQLVSEARLVLSCDTGIAHVAIGLRVPSVILFGAVAPVWWGAPPGCLLHRSLWKGRLGEPYAPQPDPGLLQISVAEVLETALGAWPDAAYVCPFVAASD